MLYRNSLLIPHPLTFASTPSSEVLNYSLHLNASSITTAPSIFSAPLPLSFDLPNTQLHLRLGFGRFRRPLDNINEQALLAVAVDSVKQTSSRFANPDTA